ncbi:angiotensin-converting enzyme-like [Ostrinia furnacalis]|uniref:angiotensin-converting enzyme-like n=1 Tax=Ostrinia furnacalis TaxID=93504 RepID=UPI001039C8CA|nr:angiotensin-converting enzyme-like [Ostrinia furnacalis]
MRLTISLRFFHFFVLLLSATLSNGNDSELLTSAIDLVEFDYTDNCADRASATWDALIGSPKGLQTKLERDKEYKIFVKKNLEELKTITKHSLTQTDDLMKRKVHLLLQPGDVLLDTDQWIRLVTFADKAQNKIRFATNYDCGSRTCALREFHNSLAKEQDEAVLKKMKQSWESNLPDINEYVEQILPLLGNASKDYKTVEEYWDSLVEYEGAILKARELWEGVKPLYVKLHKYVALRLLGDKEVGGNLPVHLLRSLNGDDWSNVIDSLLPKHPAVYQKVTANLQIKNLGGENAFKAAANLIKELNLGEIKPEIWQISVFNSSCPPVLVDYCKPNKMKVVTCKDVSIGNYLDAHETAMKIAFKKITASYSNNTFVLREAPRYSAIYEAIPGFLSLLALSPHALARNDLFNIELFNLNNNHHRMVLQLILALRDLAKLNFYLAADEWRLKVLTGNTPSSKTAASWSEFRRNFSQLETSDIDLLGDPYVQFNKPFIGKFMGLILKYQIYHSFAEELESDDSDLIKHIAEHSNRLSDVMFQGFSVKWPELVSDLLFKKENGLEYTGLIDYYRLLEEYLDDQFDPVLNNIESIDAYYDPAELNVDEKDLTYDFDANFDENSAVESDEHIPDLSESPKINIIDTGDEDGVETTTVKMLESKPNLTESYNMYWWIGIAVALAVVVILIAIIARKRHNHRKQLEKQRRENSRA